MKCSRCKYRTTIGGDLGQVVCYYIANTGKRRGCPFGEECTRFEEGEPKNFIREVGHNSYNNRKHDEL